MRKLEVDTVRKMIADREAENRKEWKEADIESPLVTVSVIDLIFWGVEIFMLGACAILLVALLLKQ